VTAGRWIVYILECADDTLYTGITNDMPRRLAAHESGKGAKYTRGRGPYKILTSKRLRAAAKRCGARRRSRRCPAPISWSLRNER
jgi:putative endonuclease